MAEEATIITLLGNQGDPVEYTVADAGSIMKGSSMFMSASPQTGSRATADTEFFIGFAGVEKAAGDGVTKMPCITNCVAQVTAGTGNTTLGQPQKIANGENVFIDADNDTIAASSETAGVALETAVDGARFAMRVNI